MNDNQNTPDEAVEKAARAIFEHDDFRPEDAEAIWLAEGDDYRTAARKALAAALSAATPGADVIEGTECYCTALNHTRENRPHVHTPGTCPLTPVDAAAMERSGATFVRPSPGVDEIVADGSQPHPYSDWIIPSVRAEKAPAPGVVDLPCHQGVRGCTEVGEHYHPDEKYAKDSPGGDDARVVGAEAEAARWRQEAERLGRELETANIEYQREFTAHSAAEAEVHRLRAACEAVEVQRDEWSDMETDQRARAEAAEQREAALRADLAELADAITRDSHCSHLGADIRSLLEQATDTAGAPRTDAS